MEIDNKIYSRLLDRLENYERTIIEDSKYLSVISNMYPKETDKAFKLIQEVGLNEALKASKNMV